MFGKKKKISPEEAAKERERRLGELSDKLNQQIAAIGRQKQILVGKVLEAKGKNLPAQEKQARGLLGKCLATEKRVSGMLMTLELAVQSRDLADLNRQFVECIGEISSEIDLSVDKTNVKGAEKKYMHALYKVEQQAEMLDGMLDRGDFAAATAYAEQGDGVSDYEEEIDALIENAESEARRGYRQR